MATRGVWAVSILNPFHLSIDMPVDTTVPVGHHTCGSMSSLSWVGDLCSSLSSPFLEYSSY